MSLRCLFVKLTLIALAVVPSIADAWDSVAVIHRPQKVLIQINEKGAQGRLQSLMDSLGAGQSAIWISKDQSLKMDCGRNLEAASCVIRMLPSEFVQIENRLVQAQMPFDELAIDHADLKGAPELVLRFLNSNGDHLQLRILHSGLEIKAGKR